MYRYRRYVWTQQRTCHLRICELNLTFMSFAAYLPALDITDSDVCLHACLHWQVGAGAGPRKINHGFVDCMK
jgi:hypothetical protein